MGWLARRRDRIAAVVSPWLGGYGLQYEPRELRVPAWYLRSRLPEPVPTISIVTPSLDQGRFIARAVESVLAQGYPRLEYVIQDGGSSDETLARLERYRSRLTRIESGPDRGQAAAINKGFSGASGDLLCWLNADDVLLPGSLAYVARWFARCPEIDILYGNRVLIDESDRDYGVWVLPRHHPHALRWINYVPQECTFWRRRIWERCGPLDEGIRYVMDWDLLRRFEAGGARFAHTRRYLAAFRRHASQKTYRAENEELLAEWELMQRRWNGVDATPTEGLMRAQPYRLRAIPARWRERVLDRMPFPRVSVHLPP